jgi:class 3 adenylate cyclase/uncharacterized protein YggT (Ycf19 family)
MADSSGKDKDKTKLSGVVAAAGAARSAAEIREQIAAAASAKKGMAALRARIAVAGAARFFLRSGKNLLLAFVALALAASFLSRFKDVKKYPAFERIVVLDQRLEIPMLAFVRGHIPTNFEGSDVSRMVLFGCVIVLALVLRGVAFKFHGDVESLRRKRDALLKATSMLDAGKLDRSKLLEVYAEVRKSLDQHKQNLAFLSIDVVDSTGMKIGEDPGIAENDFRLYKRMVDDILRTNNQVKAAWTPDGVMICFSTTADALRAAMGVINGLDSFNASVKHMKRDFRIRAGVNSGEVFCDEATPMEEMADRVIDIAGHMQKHGIADGICVSKHSVEPILDKFPFKDAGREVDGCPVYEWKKGDKAG